MKSFYSSPPLPFNGNKRYWINNLYNTFKDIKFNKDVLIVDLFGGSGLLSHLFAYMYPNNTVIYNDYDNYTKLLNEKYINKFNEFIKYGYNLMIENNIKKDKVIPQEIKKKIINKMYSLFGDEYNKNDKIKNIICANMCFSGRDRDIIKNDIYNKFNKNPYEVPKDYILDNIKVVHEDYKDLIKSLSKYPKTKIFYILDPPYLSTTKYYYDKYFGLNDTINIIRLCVEYKCILFESDKSEILPLLQYIKERDKTKINMKISYYKQLGGSSENKDYFVLFNF
jgi:hypothetical protein